MSCFAATETFTGIPGLSHSGRIETLEHLVNAGD